LVHPTPKRQRYAVTPYARLSAIMGIEMFPKLRSPEEMLAEQGLSAMPFLANERTLSSQKQHMAEVVPLGRWCAAAA